MLGDRIARQEAIYFSAFTSMKLSKCFLIKHLVNLDKLKITKCINTQVHPDFLTNNNIKLPR